MAANIRERKGNIFTTQCEAITITVNCEGFMGAGIALEGKLRWPDMFAHYQSKCTEGYEPGELIWWESNDLEQKILCFPTKGSWQQNSLMKFLELGLDALVNEYRNEGITSIAMPHLGCSHGGLKWAEVFPLIVKKLGGVTDLEVELWEFDPHAADPHFDDLVDLINNFSASEIQARLQLTSRQFADLTRAIHSQNATNFSGLQQARGIGEQTLKKIYDYLFRIKPQKDFDFHEPTHPWVDDCE